MNRQTLIQKLKEDIAQGRVVIIAGTGLSVMVCGNQEVEGCKVATWTGLLEHGVKHCKDIGKSRRRRRQVTHGADQEPQDELPHFRCGRH